VTLLAELALTSEAVRETPARGRKVALLAERLSKVQPDEVPVAVAYLSGELTQRQTGVGWAALREMPPAAPVAILELLEVDDAFRQIAALSGRGALNGRRELLRDLLMRATPAEQRFLRGLVSGELRQGAQEGVLADAVAKAAGLPATEIRRAQMLTGDLWEVARLALIGSLEGVSLRVGRPLAPMLASTAADLGDAFTAEQAQSVEWKLDGARIQVHRLGSDVSIFTRSLDDVTGRLPEIVAAALALPATAFVLDAEAIALHADGRPYPFQVTGSRFASQEGLPLTPFVFDILHLDGRDLIDEPLAERRAALERLAPAIAMPRIVASTADEARPFYEDSLARGHEGVMVKTLEAPYEAGRRGAAWRKVKHVHTLDLVILAAEWGHGRRRGWLSNLHLGARDGDSGGFVMLGKTFKGLTDAMLRWQTERLLELAVDQNDWVVHVRPELVVEIAFDGVQASPRYPAGMALRFARVKGYREDKTASECDTVQAVRAIFEGTRYSRETREEEGPSGVEREDSR
jgi:ATP-dependent DNA ligase I